MTTDDARPEPYESTSRWSLGNWVDAAVARIPVGGATVVLLAVSAPVTGSVLGTGA